MKFSGFASVFVVAAAVVGGVAIAARGDTLRINAMGTVEPDAVVDVNTTIPGIIEKIENADSSKQVKKGDLLAELDSKVYRNAVEQAEAGMRAAEANVGVAKAEVELAQKELERSTKRAANKNADALDVDVARAALEVAKAKVQSAVATIEQEKIKTAAAKINLGACHIVSPIDGVVIANRASVGRYIAPAPNDSSLFLIADVSKMSIWASVSEDRIADVKVGMPVQISFDAIPGKTYSGKVSQLRLNAAAHENQVFYTVVIPLEVKDSRILPYMTAKVEINPSDQK